jgi:glycosyltransferase involved in cell wall biosynthesis
MAHKGHILVIDPISFRGGSKVATESILRLLDTDKIKITVLSADPNSWQWTKLHCIPLYQIKWLAQQEQGITYFLSHLWIAMQIILLRIRLGRIDIGVGASGPGVDLALYLIKSLLGFKVIQLIHGPVATSNTIARCLQSAEQIFYLSSSHQSLINCLQKRNPSLTYLPTHFQLMENGLSKQHWPSRCQQQQSVVLWAASLLKWKGLDTLLIALDQIPIAKRPETHICYIKPKNTQLPISTLPQDLAKVNYYQNPHNLDQIRSSANIFVSTSNNEPFGLSILEALAAGHCVVIPEDGAYWDQQLQDNINCIKYPADDALQLMDKLIQLNSNLLLVTRIGQQGLRIAQAYRAENKFANIQTYIDQNTLEKG